MGYLSHYILMECNLFSLLYLIMILLPFRGIVINPSLDFLLVCKIQGKGGALYRLQNNSPEHFTRLMHDYLTVSTLVFP